MNNKKFEKIYEKFIYKLFQFRRYFKNKYGIRVEYQIGFYDREGNFVKGIRSK